MIQRRVLSWMLGWGLYAIGLTCRVRCHRDLRHVIRRDGGTYIFAALHAHQIGSAMCGDTNIGAMVSRSGDGEIIVPTLRLFGIRPIRGSSGTRKKGGARAIVTLIRHVRDGGAAFLAVDGPGGPRNQVQRGVAMLASKTEAPVLAVVVVPSRRWILSKTWDRLQIPKPFSTITVHFSRPISFTASHTLESFAGEVQAELSRMERWYDPQEATMADPSMMISDDEPADQNEQHVSTPAPIRAAA